MKGVGRIYSDYSKIRPDMKNTISRNSVDLL